MSCLFHTITFAEFKYDEKSVSDNLTPFPFLLN